MDRKKYSRKTNGEGTVYLDKRTGRWVAEIHWVDDNKKTHRKRFSGAKQAKVKADLV